MKYLIATSALALLTACGGGSDTDPTTAASAQAAQTTEATESQAAVMEISLTADAPVNNLDLSTAATFATSSAATGCGYSVPSKSITGTVTSVHDGDTITVGSTKIRLDSIDAPELAQTYGKQSRDNLSSLVLNKHVTVYYAKLDKYGRTVGSVFTDNCVYANLQQVQTGSAWHYKQYQCEQPASLRSVFASAQSAAEVANLGLWAFNATAPWVYRNGADPTPPTCSSDSPSWVSSAPATGAGMSATQPTNTCYKVWVNGYRRANGTYVSGYYRNSPGC